MARRYLFPDSRPWAKIDPGPGAAVRPESLPASPGRQPLSRLHGSNLSTPFFSPAPIDAHHERFFALTRQLQRRNADLDAFILAWRHAFDEMPTTASNREHMAMLLAAAEQALAQVMAEGHALDAAGAGFIHISGLEHLLRTPFTFVKGYWDLITTQLAREPTAVGYGAGIQEYIGGIMTGIARLNAECIKLLRLAPTYRGFTPAEPVRFSDVAADIHSRHDLMRYSAEKRPTTRQGQVRLLRAVAGWPALHVLRQGLVVIYDEILWAIDENEAWQVRYASRTNGLASFELQFRTFPATFHFTPSYARAMGGSALWQPRTTPTLLLLLPVAPDV